MYSSRVLLENNHYALEIGRPLCWGRRGEGIELRTAFERVRERACIRV